MNPHPAMAAIQRFRDLQRYMRVQRRPLHERIAVQYELWSLAQVICHWHAPRLQRELDEARIAVMQELQPDADVPLACRAARPLHAIAMAPHRVPISPRLHDWTLFDLTPEVANTNALLGRSVSKRAAQRLIKARKAQVQAVLRCIAGGWGGVVA